MGYCKDIYSLQKCGGMTSVGVCVWNAVSLLTSPQWAVLPCFQLAELFTQWSASILKVRTTRRSLRKASVRLLLWIQFNFVCMVKVQCKEVLEQNGTHRFWGSQGATHRQRYDEQRTTYTHEGRVSSHDQKNIPNVAGATNEYKMLFSPSLATAKLYVWNNVIVLHGYQHDKNITSVSSFPLTNLNVNVFKALGSSTIFCKLAATVKYKHRETVSKLFPITLDFHINDLENLTNDAINCKIISFTGITKSI